jgi:nucleoside-diphosphate-sugar epimerase
VATGIETSILKISELLLAKFGLETPVRFEGVENAGNPDNWRADIGNMRKLGFAPAIGIEEGVERYVHWFRSLA